MQAQFIELLIIDEDDDDEGGAGIGIHARFRTSDAVDESDVQKSDASYGCRCKTTRSSVHATAMY